MIAQFLSGDTGAFVVFLLVTAAMWPFRCGFSQLLGSPITGLSWTLARRSFRTAPNHLR